jgi:integrase
MGSQGSQLRLWQPEEAHQLTCILPSSTLSEFYESYYRDVGLLGSRPATYEGYEQTLKHWKTITGDPALSAIDRLIFSRFVTRLMLTMSKRTARKHAILINAMVEESGFPGVMTRQIRKSLRAERRLPEGDWSEDEVTKMLTAAGTMQRSSKTGPLQTHAFWRLFVNAAYLLGEHRDELMSIRLSHVDLQGGHISIPSRQKTGKPNYKPIHPSLAELIQATWSNRDRLLPWRDWDAESWTTARNSRADFHKRFIRLLELAGIPKARQSLGTRGFRKMHLTRLAETSMSAAQGSANHADIAVTLGHYVSGEVQRRRRQVELDKAILSLPPIQAAATTQGKESPC